MRTKIFEELIPLQGIYEIAIEILKAEFTIKKESNVSDSDLCLLAKKEDVELNIKGFIDNRMKRTILFFNIKVLDGIKQVEIEKQMFSEVLYKIYSEFNYKNRLMRYPFSLSDIDGDLESWGRLVGPYISLIEKNLNSDKQPRVRTFRDYDFAKEDALYQRIVDLVLFEEFPIAEEEDIDQIKNLRIVFFFVHKKRTSMKYIKYLKISNEVKKYAALLQKKKKKIYKEVSPEIVFISLSGYEKQISNHLKDNIVNKTNNIIPKIIVPNNGKVWHNFKNTNSVDLKLKAELKAFIDRSSKSETISTNRQRLIEEKKKQYAELIEKEVFINERIGILQNWQNILDLESSHELLELDISKIC